jgi:hypothetical protein
MKIDFTDVNYLSLFPISQQITGVGTIILNIAKIIKDLGNRAFLDGNRKRLKQIELKIEKDKRDIFFSAWKEGNNQPSTAEQRAQQKTWEKLIDYYEEAPLNSKLGLAEQHQANIRYIKDRLKAENTKRIINHVTHIGIGVLRLLPIVGTIYSVCKIYQIDIKFRNKISQLIFLV